MNLYLEKIQQDNEDDTYLLKLNPLGENENLITIVNQMSTPESLMLLKKWKEERKNLKIFIKIMILNF